jgi:membrane protease YdiL (CAAX protease family)
MSDPQGPGPPSTRESASHRDAGRLVTTGMVIYPLVVWGFWARLDFALADAAFTGGLVVLLPLLAVAQIPLAMESRVERVPAYVASAVTVSALGAIAIALGSRRMGAGGMGLGAVGLVRLLLWTLGLIAAGGLVVVLFHLLRRSLRVAESPLLRELLPRTSTEKRFFIVLSLCAGFGEEVAFRGYALSVLSDDFGGGWGAAALTSVVFGLLHAYQGPLGIGRTALLGFVLASAVLLGGSVWPCVCAHVALDLLGGLVWGERLTA